MQSLCCVLAESRSFHASLSSNGSSHAVLLRVAVQHWDISCPNIEESFSILYFMQGMFMLTLRPIVVDSVHCAQLCQSLVEDVGPKT